MEKKGRAGILNNFFLAVFLLALVSCEEDIVTSANGPKIRPLTSEEQFFIESTNELAIDLLREKENSNQNILISPISVGATLGIIGNAVSESEYTEFGKKVGFPLLPRIEINKAFYEVSTMLPYLDKEISIDFHNSLWTKYNLSENEGFYNQVLAYYNADIQELLTGKDFNSKHIDKWTQLNSNSKITEIDKFNFGSDFQIVNLGLFRGSFFEDAIPEIKTAKFYADNGSVYETKMNLFVNKKIEKYDVNGAAVYAIPINNANFVLELSMEENALDDIHLSRSEQIELIQANLLIPDIKSTYELYLNKDLGKYEIDEMLDKALSDNFLLNQRFNSDYTFLNKSLLEISGRSGETITDNGLVVEKVEPKDVISIDKPFYFFVKERNSNLIIFEGKYSRPQ